MLSTKEYIVESLEHNLFFLRIMKEHLIFAVSAITPRDYNLIQSSLLMKSQLENLLREAVIMSNGVVSPGSIASGEFVTPFTLNAEIQTQNYTAVPIDTEITKAETALKPSGDFAATAELERKVSDLNQRALSMVEALIQVKTTLYNNVISCRMFTHLYPTLLEHVRNEAESYRMMLQMLQRRESMDKMEDIPKHEEFWNHILHEHAEFIRGMLDPREKALIKKADSFADLFEELTEAAKMAQSDPGMLLKVTNDSLQATAEIRNFKAQGTQGILTCNIRSVILPLLSDHVLREASHYYRMLMMYEQGL